MTLITATSIAIKASTIPTYKNIWFTAETFIKCKSYNKSRVYMPAWKGLSFFIFWDNGGNPEFFIWTRSVYQITENGQYNKSIKWSDD